jgi:hypothetical protein
MKYFFYTIVFFIIFLYAFGMSNQIAQRIELLPKPEFQSVVIKGVSSCEKKSEMNLIEQWEKKCESIGQSKNCSLPNKDVKPMFEYKAWYVNNCR